MKFVGKRGDLELETLIRWILIFLLLIVLFIAIGILARKGTGAIDYFKGIWKIWGK